MFLKLLQYVYSNIIYAFIVLEMSSLTLLSKSGYIQFYTLKII